MAENPRAGICARCEGPTAGQDVIEAKGEHLHRHYPDCIAYLHSITSDLYEALELFEKYLDPHASPPPMPACEVLRRIRVALLKANPQRKPDAQ